MADRYIGYTITARLGDKDREALDQAIATLLGCTDTETDCPMVELSSTVGTLDQVTAWHNA